MSCKVSAISVRPGYGFIVATTVLHCFVVPDVESAEIFSNEISSPAKIIKQSTDNFLLVHVSGEVTAYDYSGQQKCMIQVPGKTRRCQQVLFLALILISKVWKHARRKKD